MSVNQSFAMNPEKVRKLGKYFSSIDFSVYPEMNRDLVRERLKSTPVGDFHIGGKDFQLNLGEIEHVIETMELARETFLKKFSMRV